jgi:hypothetical protein
VPVVVTEVGEVAMERVEATTEVVVPATEPAVATAAAVAVLPPLVLASNVAR